jgi:mono/diheme cytochrome c family protein
MRLKDIGMTAWIFGWMSIGVIWSLAAPVEARAEPIDYVKDVRPIFERHCTGCHGEKKQKSGFRLDVKAAALRGGDVHGVAIRPGKPDESLLIRVVSDRDADERMPPDGDGLSADEVAVLRKWVEEGAVWPDGVDRVVLADRRDHWSFQPVPEQTLPAVRDAGWVRSDLDRFILARLEAEGLSPAPEASRRDWLRRVTFDLHGLPPTPEELAAFEVDASAEAYGRVVDRLLASPRYGERWGQHWLDVVRYADTHGFEVNTERPDAWPYRDYVIDALNRDTPYDQFIREQIAGDTLGRSAATGFLITASVLLPGQIGADEPSKRLARQDSLDEIVMNIGQTFLGLSVGCARCHDHKFDPITQTDYYAMQAFVAGVEYLDRDLVPEAAAAWQRVAMTARPRIDAIDAELSRFATPVGVGVKRPAVNAKLNIDRFRPVRTRRVRFTVLKTNSLEPCIDELEVFTRTGVNQSLASMGTVTRSSGDNVSPNRHELRFVNDGRYGNESSWMSNETGGGWVEVEFPEETEVAGVRWGRDRQGKYNDRLAIEYRIEAKGSDDEWFQLADHTDREEWTAEAKPAAATVQNAGLTDDEIRQRDALIVERTHWQAQVTAAERTPKVFSGRFREPDVIRTLSRGDPEQPRDLVVPAVLSALGNQRLEEKAPESERRQVLADWIASPDNPLTARVMANRVWQGHFGIGLVETASDFGRSGTAPTHKELLDWLARRLIVGKWSLKSLHREIVLSATYRQSSQWNEAAAAVDRDARWLWRYPTRRLEAEAMRDSMLFVAGRLNLAMYGRGFDLFDRRGGLTGFTPIESFQGAGLRRMIYAHKVRREREAVFGAFDCPDAGQSTARRRESTTPIQALNLFNSRFTLEAAEALVARVEREAGKDAALSTRIDRMYALVLNRPPTEEERAEAVELAPRYGLVPLGRALFNSNEFLFVP